MDDIPETQRQTRDRLLRILGGPAVTVVLAVAIALLQATHLLEIPNVGVIFLAVLVVTCLTGEARPTLANLVLTLAATLFLYAQTDRLAWSGTGLVRLLVPTITFPIVCWLVLMMRRRLSAALEAPVQAERQLFQAVMASMHDAIVETDWQGIRDVNDSFCRMTGFTRDELIGAKAPYPFWPIEQYASIAAALETSMRGKAMDFELVLTRKNGERFPVLLSVSRILDSGSTRNRVLYSFREIAELKRTQEQLQESRRQLQTAINSARMGAWEVDLKTMVVTWSGHHEQLWGMKPGEFRGTVQEIVERVHPEDREEFRHAASVYNSGGAFEHEFRVVWPDGSIHWISAAGRGSLEGGQVLRSSGVVRDVTEQRQTAMLLAGQRTVLEKIARGASLEETLTTLVLTMENLMPGTRCTALTLAPDRKHLHVAAAPHMAAECNKRTEWLEIREGAGTCGTAAFRRSRVIHTNVATEPAWTPFLDLAERFELRACTSEPIFAGDGRLLGTFAVYYRQPQEPAPRDLRVLELAANLAAIAIERDREERELRDAKENAEIANRTKDRFLNLLSHELRSPLTPILTLASVLERDGRMPEDLRPDIEMIRRNAEVEAQLVDDLLELVRMAQGPVSMDIEASVRELRESGRIARAGSTAGSETRGTKQPLRILLVEDHVDTAKTLAKVLSKRGHLVTMAGNVADAVAAGTGGEFDILLSDIGLPDGSGLDVVKRIREVRPIPAIALSGFGSPEDIRRSLEAGFEMHLTKPVDFQTLLAVIERVTS